MQLLEKNPVENLNEKGVSVQVSKPILPKNPVENVAENDKNGNKIKPILPKNPVENAAQNDELGRIPQPILPKNERQIRPLLNKLEHHGERIKVWAKVVATGEKINAELVQTKVDEFLESDLAVPVNSDN